MVGILEFFELANKLKWIERRGWVAKVKVREPESVADHSYVTAVMCMILAEQRGLDSGKAVKMALLHDIAESMTGDLLPDEMSKKMKKGKEMKAMQDLLAKLPPKVRSSCNKLWTDYRNMSSREAVLVRQVDKLEMALQAKDYREKGYASPHLTEFFRYAEKGISDKELLELLKILKQAS